MIGLTSDLNNFSKEKINNITVNKLKTGIGSLDKILGGGLSAGITAIGAAPGTGKSTLVFQIAYNISKNGTPVIIYSLEMPRNYILAKAISMKSFETDRKNAVSASDIISGAEYVNWDAVEKARKEVEKDAKNIYITESSDKIGSDDNGISADDIIKEVGEFIEKTKTKPFVVVDYLQFLSGGTNKFLSERQVIDENTRKLLSFANLNDICIFLISSANRDSYKSKAEITLTSFKESGCIEYSANALMGMYNDESGSNDPDERKIILKILKQRYGGLGEINLIYHSKYDFFEDYEPKAEEKPERKKPKRKNDKKEMSVDDIEKMFSTAKEERR